MEFRKYSMFSSSNGAFHNEREIHAIEKGWLISRLLNTHQFLGCRAVVDDGMMIETYQGCTTKSAPEVTLWWNFFPEPVLPDTSSHDLGCFQGNLTTGFNRIQHLRGNSCSKTPNTSHNAPDSSLASLLPLSSSPRHPQKFADVLISSHMLQATQHIVGLAPNAPGHRLRG